MSVEALDIFDQQRTEQVGNGPFSESFTYEGGTFTGVFDKSHIERNKDAGNVNQTARFPRIMVSEIPSGLTRGVTVITRVRTAEEYKFKSYGLDDEGIQIIWLY